MMEDDIEFFVLSVSYFINIISKSRFKPSALSLFKKNVRQSWDNPINPKERKLRKYRMKNESITIRISEIEKEQLKLIAEKRDIPMSQMIREMIKEIIQKESK